MKINNYINLMLIAFLGIVLFSCTPAFAGNLQNISPGGDVFIGEQGLNLIGVVPGTTFSYYMGTQTPGQSAPAATITVGNPTNFYIAPSDFVGRTGNWYTISGGVATVAIVVKDPSQTISVYDQQTGKAVTGQNVTVGDFLIFRLETNLNVIPAERNSGTIGFMTIKVKSPDGTVYTLLHQDGTTTQSLLNQAPNAMPYYWNSISLVLNSQKGWSTGFLGSDAKYVYPEGTYSFWTESNLNGIKDNYKDASGNDYIGKTVSAVHTVTLSSTPTPTPSPTLTPTIQNIPFGGDVFIGEQGLNLIGVVPGTVLNYYTRTQTPGVSAPAATIAVGNPANFYVAPSDFVGRTGTWYIGNTAIVGLVVNDPLQTVSIYDQQTGKDVTGKSITAGDFLNFRIETNLAVIPIERQSGTTGFMTIKVKAPDGTVYTYLYQDGTTTQSLLNQSPNAMPYYWNSIPLVLNSQKGWATGFLNSQSTKIYQDGTYTFWTESNLNRMQDNYRDAFGNDYVGRTVSAIKTITITSTPSPTPSPTPTPIIQNVYPGGDVFIGEQGLNLIGVAAGTVLNYYTVIQTPGQSAPAAIVTVIDPTNFYVAPSDFVGRTGNWYIVSGNSANVAIVVNDPSQTISVYDQQTGNAVTGHNITAGDFLIFRLETNLNVIPAERNSGTTGFMTIKVKSPGGIVYTYLHQDGTTNQSLLNQTPNAMPYYWNNIPLVIGSDKGWATGFLGPLGEKIYPAGSYTFWTESNLNGMQDNYKDAEGNDYIGKTVSAVRNVQINVDSPSENLMNLYQGWNFVSTPKKLASGSNTVDVVFANVDFDHHSPLLYNGQTKSWIQFTSGEIKPLDGIWVYSKYQMDIPLQYDITSVPLPPSKPVYQGWNAIGETGIHAISAHELLTQVGQLNANWDTLIGYNTTMHVSETYIRGSTNLDFSDLKLTYPTKGYWLQMNTNDTLEGLL